MPLGRISVVEIFLCGAIFGFRDFSAKGIVGKDTLSLSPGTLILSKESAKQGITKYSVDIIFDKIMLF
jgi:hypothetical protein